MSLREKLQPDYGEKYVIDEQGNVLSSGGSIRRHFAAEALGPERAAVVTLVKLILIRAGLEIAVFEANQEDKVLIRINPSEARTYFYMHQVCGDYIGPLVEIGLPSFWNLVTTDTVQELAHFNAKQFDVMSETLVGARRIPLEEYHQAMRPYYLLTRPFSE